MKSYIRSILLCAGIVSSATGLWAQTITLISGNGPIGTRDPTNSFSLDGGLTFTNAFIISPTVNDDTIAGTKWISVASTGNGPSNFTNIYRAFFTLPAGYANPSLTIHILADDQASVFLNGVLIGAEPFPTNNVWYYKNPGFVFGTNDPSLFLVGQNTVSIRSYNQPDVWPTNPTGIDYQLEVVPEPSTFVLAATGLVCMVGFCSRCRK